MFIGREKECEQLRQAMNSNRSEFVVIYGRRRVGKTFLVRNFFHDKYAFRYVGDHGVSTSKQLSNFSKSLSKYSGRKYDKAIHSWSDAFDCLQTYLESIPLPGKKVVFFDEMPWIDKKRSGFVSALEYFWNNWVMERDDIVFVACGSSTSWMVDKLIDNRGGLHGRITRRIYLHSFTLRECQQYLNEAGFDWDEYQILQNYMVMGGVPYYLSLLEPTMSLQQNIDNLFFSHDAILGKEFDELYNALFTNADRYLTIVKLLSKHRKGLTRKEIEKATGFSGGSLSRTLTNLEQCDFIMGYNQIGNKSKQTIYKLVDFYTYFYYRFVENNRSNDENYWMHHFQDHSVEAWEGFSFELICQLHSYQIKFALGISGIATEVASWRSMTDEHSAGSQVDLVIKRVDKIVHLCEMKFCEKPFVISSDYATKLKNRKTVFCEKTGITRGVVNTFVTPYGVQKGKYQNIVHSEVTAKDLFLR